MGEEEPDLGVSRRQSKREATFEVTQEERAAQKKEKKERKRRLEEELAQADADTAADLETIRKKGKKDRNPADFDTIDESADVERAEKKEKKRLRLAEATISEANSCLEDNGKRKKCREAPADPTEYADGAEPAPRKKEKKRKIQEEGAEEGALASKVATDDTSATEPEKKKQKKRERCFEDAEVVEEVAGGEADMQERTEKKEKKKKKSRTEETDAAEDVATQENKQENTCREAAALAENAGLEAGEGYVVCVGNLPWEATEKIIRRDFRECGEVLDVRMLKDRQTDEFRGIAFITFADEAGRKAALKFDGDDYGGRKLRVNEAQAKVEKVVVPEDPKVLADRSAFFSFEVFIRGLFRETDQKTLESTLRAKCGGIDRVNMPVNEEGKSKGFAWVTFTTKEGMEKAVALNQHTVMGRRLTIEKSGQHLSVEGSSGKGKGKTKSKGKGKGKGKGISKGKTDKGACKGAFEIFVKNLPYEAEQSVLRETFSECDAIKRINMPMIEGKCQGFAWISFSSEGGVDRAVALSGADFGGRQMHVEKAGQHRSEDK
eukprot:TRINITY_DN20105_c2_g2_i1.p1 TRINITY_DN20105_c2_g2~~TRINITY_DN20105_c2_g2_i1.p1  ORF type:complete len:550 (-),score=144.79 TRINITY_DN20105_c2_g2_i1:89-1738(-)